MSTAKAPAASSDRICEKLLNVMKCTCVHVFINTRIMHNIINISIYLSDLLQFYGEVLSRGIIRVPSEANRLEMLYSKAK